VFVRTVPTVRTVRTECRWMGVLCTVNTITTADAAGAAILLLPTPLPSGVGEGGLWVCELLV
jgi:hypothetical protein